MAGTLAEIATLAGDNSFIAKVRGAMIKRAVELVTSETAQNLKTLQQMQTILGNAGGNAENIAWLVAAGNATIAAAAPAVPSDGDTQYAVNTQLALLT